MTQKYSTVIEDIRASNRLGGVFRWALDRPTGSFNADQADESVRVAGWALASGSASIRIAIKRSGEAIELHELTIRRADVLNHVEDNRFEAQLRCGFDFTLACGLPGFEIGLQVADAIHWTCAIRFEPTVSPIVGDGGWLFLDGDTNKSVLQYEGKRQIDEDARLAWKLYFDNLEVRMAELPLEYAFMVVPSKEFVLGSKYPFGRGANTVLDQMQSLMTDFGGYFDCLSVLNKDPEASYWRGDTHWTDYGAMKVVLAIMLKFEISASSLYKTPFRYASVLGDLGSKVIPGTHFDVAIADRSEEYDHMLFDNLLVNEGRVQIFQNTTAPIATTCVIFGSSSCYQLNYWLSMLFRRVVFFHNMAAIDWGVIEFERPSHVIVQANLRFCVRAPAVDADFHAAISKKLIEMNGVEKLSAVTRIKQRLDLVRDDVGEFYYRLHGL